MMQYAEPPTETHLPSISRVVDKENPVKETEEDAIIVRAPHYTDDMQFYREL